MKRTLCTVVPPNVQTHVEKYGVWIGLHPQCVEKLHFQLLLSILRVKKLEKEPPRRLNV